MSPNTNPMSANITNGGGRNSTQTTLDGDTVVEEPGSLGIEGFGAILWRVGREHPDADVSEQARIACERAREQGVELSGGAE